MTTLLDTNCETENGRNGEKGSQMRFVLQLTFVLQQTSHRLPLTSGRRTLFTGPRARVVTRSMG
jgi:hypothetical protein